MAAVSIRNSTLFADANLQAYWELENVNDSKGSYTLTNNGTTQFNAALFNNGADQGTSNTTKYLNRTGDCAGLTSSTTPFTIMGWVKFNTEIGSGQQAIFDSYVGSSLRENAIYYDYNGGTRRLQFITYHNSSGDHTYTINYNVALGTSSWHFVAFTWDGSGTNVGYVDGVSVGTSNPNTGAGSATTPQLSLGANLGAANLTNAIFDDWAVFNRALSSTEISNHYSGADALPSGGNGVVAFFMR